FNADGSPDITFGPNGRHILPAGVSAEEVVSNYAGMLSPALAEGMGQPIQQILWVQGINHAPPETASSPPPALVSLKARQSASGLPSYLEPTPSRLSLSRSDAPGSLLILPEGATASSRGAN